MAQNPARSGEGNALHVIEETVHTVVYPCTEIMMDVGELHFKHAGKNVLVPQPSDDLSDPLNWRTLWKMVSMGGMAVTTFSWTVGPLAISSQVPYYMAEWDRSLQATVVGLSMAEEGVGVFAYRV